MSNPSNLTKKFLKSVMRARLIERTFNRDQFIKEFDIPDRRARRYLNELADEIAETKNPELTILKAYCLENLKEKAEQRNLSEKALIKIALSGEVQRAEVTTNYSEEVTHKTVIQLDPTDRNLLNNIARRYIKASNQAESASIH